MSVNILPFEVEFACHYMCNILLASSFVSALDSLRMMAKWTVFK